MNHIKCFILEDKPFLFGTLCHHEKCGGFGLFVGTVLSLGVGYLISWYLLYLLKWDKSLSVCFYLSFMLIGFCRVHMLNFGINHVLVWFFDIIWTTVGWVTLLCAFMVYLVFCPNCISIWLLKVLWMHIYYMYILWHACFLWSNI